MKRRLQKDGNQYLLILFVHTLFTRTRFTLALAGSVLHISHSVSSLHIDAHLHTHKCACVWACMLVCVRERESAKHTVSNPLLFSVLIEAYCRSQLCNCVGVAYFLSHTLLFFPSPLDILFTPYYLHSSFYFKWRIAEFTRNSLNARFTFYILQLETFVFY